MEAKDIVDALNDQPLYELFRISHAIDYLLNDPRRIRDVRRRLYPGREIEYFDDVENRIIQAKILKLKRTRVMVERIDNGAIWDIYYYMLNIDKKEDEIPVSKSETGMNISQLHVGSKVGFRDQEGNERYGEVTKLNPKTVNLLVDGTQKWRVDYSLLFPVIESK